MASTVDCSNSPRLNAFFFFKVKNAPCEADSLQVDSDSDIEMEEAKSREKPAGEAAKPTMETPTTPMATPTTPMATPRATPTTEDVQRQLHELQQKYAELLARQGDGQVPTHKGQKAAPTALAGAESSEKDAPTVAGSSTDRATAVAEGPDKHGAETGDTADLHEFCDLEKKDARADSNFLVTKLFLSRCKQF